MKLDDDLILILESKASLTTRQHLVTRLPRYSILPAIKVGLPAFFFFFFFFFCLRWNQPGFKVVVCASSPAGQKLLCAEGEPMLPTEAQSTDASARDLHCRAARSQAFKTDWCR